MDVIAVNIETRIVRVMARDKSPESADDFITLAVIRRGVDEEFYAPAPDGKYKDGDVWGKR